MMVMVSPTKPVKLKSYAIRWNGFGSITNARTASKARYEYWLDLRDAYPDARLVDIQVVRARDAAGYAGLLMTAAFERFLQSNRVRDWCRPGARCLCRGGNTGAIADADGRYLVVELDVGGRHLYHPADVEEL